MRIYSANNVFIEVTRRCNMCCAHCLRGDAESIDIQEKYIDAFLDNFEKGAYISSLTFTGGEISLNIPAIRYTLNAVFASAVITSTKQSHMKVKVSLVA